VLGSQLGRPAAASCSRKLIRGPAGPRSAGSRKSLPEFTSGNQLFSEVIDLRLQSVELFLGRIVSGPQLARARRIQDLTTAAVLPDPRAERRPCGRRWPRFNKGAGCEEPAR